MSGNYSKRSYSRPVEWVKGKQVGSGSFGSVHLAMNKATGALFAVKSAESDSGLKCLENEAEILEKLDFQHVVKCIGKEVSFGENGVKKFNLFIEYMGGGSLADVTEQFGGSLDESVIRLYTREILLGLKYIHEKGIVHSDLKCKNVLLGSSGEVKLADFGCSKRIKETEAKGNFVPFVNNSVAGSPLWMAPEVLRNEKLDFASDIWSLGCMIIEMATGKLPWATDKITNPMAAVLKIACSEERPNFPTHFSKEGLDFLEKCLCRDPRKRSRAEELLNHPFILEKKNILIQGYDDSACSPASVLDKTIFPESDYSDESSSDDEDETCNDRIRVSTLCGKTTAFGAFDNHWPASSDDWITVRTN